MEVNEVKVQEIDRLMSRIEEALNKLDEIMDEDRTEALEWYNALKDRYLGEGDLTSEDGAIEREINNAYSNVIKSTDKAVKIHDSVAKLITALVKERALLKITTPFEKLVDLDSPHERLKRLENREVQQIEHKLEEKDKLDSKTSTELQRKVDSTIYHER